MKTHYHALLLITGMLLFPVLPVSLIQAQIQKGELEKEKVDEIFAAWDSRETPGAAVAVVKDGAIIYKKGYGMANLEYDIPISPSSIFHIASVSKQFTVFSVLLLQSEGKLSLDDDIRKYIPEVPDFGKTITLRHLAAHTSGLRDQWDLLAMAGWRLDDVITKEHVLKLVSKQKELNFTPGDKFLYCNTGFTLLAEVVSRVSGQSFAEFTETNIFEPLQMSHTLFYDDHEKIVKNRTYSYHSDSTGIKKSVLSYANVGATSLFTTVEDLSLWTMNFSDLKIGNAEIIETMNTPAVLNDGEEFGGALGQFVGKYRGLNEIQHGGADAGYRSSLARFPDQNFSVIIFSNSAEFNTGRTAHQVVNIYLKEQIEAEAKEGREKSESEDEKKKSDRKDGKKKSDRKDEKIVVDRDVLNAYVGDYEFQVGMIVNVTKENDQLYAKASGQAVVKLNPLSSTKFEVEGIGAQLEFVLSKSEKVDLVRLHQGEQIQEARRLPPFDKATVNLQEFTGRFYSEEIASEYIFKIQDGKLVAQHIRLSDINLDPRKRDVFSGDAWFFSQIEFIRENDNSISGCKVSSGRVKKLEFQKID